MAAIKGGLGVGVINLSVSDNTILAVTERIKVETATLYNTNTVTATVTVFSSPDLTSVSGDQVDVKVLGANDTLDIGGIIGQGYTDNLIYVVDVTGVNAQLTYTQYSGNSV